MRAELEHESRLPAEGEPPSPSAGVPLRLSSHEYWMKTRSCLDRHPGEGRGPVSSPVP